MLKLINKTVVINLALRRAVQPFSLTSARNFVGEKPRNALKWSRSSALSCVSRREFNKKSNSKKNDDDIDDDVEEPFGSSLEKIDWRFEELRKITKDFYAPHESTLNRSKEEVQAFREQQEITLNHPAPSPIFGFDELQMPNYILNEMKKESFQNLTPIQAQGWPIVLSGHNLLAIAQTG